MTSLEEKALLRAKVVEINEQKLVGLSFEREEGDGG